MLDPADAERRVAAAVTRPRITGHPTMTNQRKPAISPHQIIGTHERRQVGT
jgi:hypothetical protein